MDEHRAWLPVGQVGEVVVRGGELMRGYDDDPEADAGAFIDGWFRTGDLGYLDEDGYLFITGRIKEVINRGGQKVSPTEVDGVLMQHPAVAEAVTFPVRHPRLGEAVAAAIVLKPGASTSEGEIRQFAASGLAYFKVPTRIVFTHEIPRGPTGKVQRGRMAEWLGQQPNFSLPPGSESDEAAPRTPIEEVLAGIWSETLGVERVGIHDDFLELGGDSIVAARIVARVGERLGVELPLPTIFAAPTLASFAEVVVQSLLARADPEMVSSLLAEVDGPAEARAIKRPVDMAQPKEEGHQQP